MKKFDEIVRGVVSYKEKIEKIFENHKEELKNTEGFYDVKFSREEKENCMGYAFCINDRYFYGKVTETFSTFLENGNENIHDATICVSIEAGREDIDVYFKFSDSEEEVKKKIKAQIEENVTRLENKIKRIQYAVFDLKEFLQ